ncbi:MAG: bifunctional 4-hydroxy-3-methylbut-2-enyl diphosphate reductase/30S ribosomal protein S1 [Firmicutes bacterium]|nr:bifunctional 4-hydroxy-3-methylbut-2-enyl diphosphate reductase/30S ribosomal protein S1 [Bacillota bacterium]
MEVRVAARAGFCFGVRRAVELARRAAAERTGPVYTLGPLIHNPQVVAELEALNVRPVRDVDEVERGTLLIRSHGVGPDVLARAREKGLEVIDATCPIVRQVQQLVHKLAREGLPVVVVGDREHPEVRGIVGWADGRAVVVGGPAEVGELDLGPRVGVVAQTTKNAAELEAVAEALARRGLEVRTFNTICRAAQRRQQAALEVAREVDLMVVVGGLASANTRELAALCRATGVPTYHVEGPGDLHPSWFRGVRKAGLTAGASTPDRVIEEVKGKMEEIQKEETGQAEDTRPQVEAREEEETRKEMQQAMSFKTFRHGEIVRGVVVHVGEDEVLVDVGAKSEGVIPLRELSCCEVSSPREVVSVGDEIEVCVLKAEDNEGRLVLSKEKADAERAWKRLGEALERQEPVQGVVREVVKGGLLVDVGVRAFLPASLVERGYVEDLGKYLGQTISARVIELNRGRRKVILSRKAVLEEEAARRRQEFLDGLEEGQVVHGVVRRLTPFGAFVDLGEVDGLLHISEMAWHRVGHPSEAVQVGQELDLRVLRVDRETGKVSLSLKQLLPDPWSTAKERYPVGSIVKARVVRLAPFGAFVQLEPGVEGLVHISHLSDRHVVHPEDVVSEGEEIEVKVLSVDPEEKRMRLSVREAVREREGRPRRGHQARNPESGEVTIGDVVGDIFEK